MSDFYINIQTVTTPIQLLMNQSSKLKDIGMDIESISSTLSVGDGSRDEISSALKKVTSKINEGSQRELKTAAVLGDIVALYIQNEKNILDVPGQKHSQTGGQVPTQSGVEKEEDQQDNNKADKQFWGIIKSLFSWGDKTKTDDSAGLAKDGLSYVEALYKFFTGDKKGLTGARDWFNLGDKSISVWGGLYDYLKNYYHGMGKTFSLSNQKTVAGIGIAGGVFGFVSSAFGAAEKIRTNNNGTAGTVSAIVGAGDGIVDLWGEVVKYGQVGEKASSSGIYSPLTIYTAIAKGYISAFSQGIESYGEYSADGVWDIDDTARTGMEFSVSGLYSMAEALSFGLISEETTGVSAKQISERIENFGKNIGDDAGNYIKNNQSLYEKYNKTNAVGQAAIIFYAAFRSRWK